MVEILNKLGWTVSRNDLLRLYTVAYMNTPKAAFDEQFIYDADISFHAGLLETPDPTSYLVVRLAGQDILTFVEEVK
jgi:hypothetical protein